ncbi:hypothetical protein CTAYLR_003423 [Chrysophaeum taylorii]|uniref:Pre-rRNA-processing protein TSR2 n=1 Tax=Chrysophaeum taylorii TaxID=2483200 RepID=A0AAD7U7Q7_9STRA|nr:hypothetical protein CTAYLR_003423 [Chrysophaeum taylorii]
MSSTQVVAAAPPQVQNGREVFQVAVRAVFSRWTLLRLAIEQGWSDGDGSALANELLHRVLALLLTDKKVYQDEVEDLLFESLESMFNALAEDGSVEEVSSLLHPASVVAGSSALNPPQAQTPDGLRGRQF